MAFEGISRNNYGRLLPLCNLSVSDGFQAREVGCSQDPNRIRARCLFSYLYGMNPVYFNREADGS